MTYRIIITLFCLFLHATTNAQIIVSSGIGPKAIRIINNGGEGIVSQIQGSLGISVFDSQDGTPLIGAHVTIESGKEEITLVTGSFGHAIYPRPLADSVKVTVSYMGYEPEEAVIKIPAQARAYLREKRNVLSEIVVTGELIAVVTKGDTTLFNAAAFKTFEGDVMSRLFEKLPGMEFRYGRLFYLGDPIQRVTIDGNRLFGDNVMLALENIRADDVVNVSVYKELDEWSQLNRIKNAEPITVANVTTKSKPTKIRNVTLNGGVGAELEPEKRKVRYSLSGTLVASRVGGSFIANAGVKNVPEGRNYDFKKLSGSFEYNNNNARRYSFNTRNYVNATRSATEAWTNQAYFPTNYDLSRNYYTQNVTDSKKSDFATYNHFFHTFKDNSRFTTFLDFKYIDDLQKSVRIISAHQDDLPTQSQHITQRDKERSYDMDARISYNKKFGTNVLISPRASAKISNNSGDGWRVDTLLSSTSHLYVDNEIGGWSHHYGGGVDVTFRLTDLLSFTVGDELSYINSKSRRTAIDMLTGITDITNSYDYRIHESNNSVNANLLYRDNDKRRGISVVSARIGWQNKDMQRDEYFPDQYTFPRSFNMLTARVVVDYKFSTFNELKVQYSRINRSISILDFREFLDNSNPVLLRVGNPSLKIPVINNIGVSGLFAKGASTYEFSVRYNWYENRIVDKPRYFRADTYLPEYDYTAFAGTSLITKENLRGGNDFGLNVTHSILSKKLKSIIRTGLSYGYDLIPAYVNEERAMITASRYLVSLGITGNFSSHLEPSLTSVTSYIDNYNGFNRTGRFSQTINFSMRALIARKIELNSTNNLYWDLMRPDVPDMERFGLVSNLSAGYRLGKQKNVTIKIEENDLFNNRQRIIIRTESDYVSTDYNYSLKRYFMLRAEWKLW